MTIATTIDRDDAALVPQVASRRDLAALMRAVCARAAAAWHMVLDIVPAQGGEAPRIVVSNWPFDTIQDVGTEALARLADSPVATFPGSRPRGWQPQALAAMTGHAPLRRLAEHGHGEVFALKVRAGRQRHLALLSAPCAGAIDVDAVARGQIACGYALARLAAARPGPDDDPLSERERECLFWVAEGKTTAEVAVILAVSANTVNSYVAHAIHKLAARNRAMAIAGAIRRGIV